MHDLKRLFGDKGYAVFLRQHLAQGPCPTLCCFIKQKRAAFLTLEAHQTESKQGEFDTAWCPDPAFVSLTH